MTDSPKDLSICIKKYRLIVHVLVAAFGISTWIGVNAIYVQVPVLVNISPEGWTLPAYLVLVIQSANVGPLFYSILKRFRWKINEPWWILCLLFLGTCAMGLLTFFYSEKTVIGEVEHSLAFFILTFFNALVGCFSSVLFMPYLNNFNKNYLVTFFIGEGFSGVLPSIISLIQGIDDNSECTISKNTTDTSSGGLTFSSSTYFLFIFCILFLSLTAFVVLEFSSFARKAKRQSKSSNSEFNKMQIIENTEKVEIHSNDDSISKPIQNYLFLLLAICCFFSYGFFPSIQSYSCLPYGNLAYKLSITFAQFAIPLVCFVAFWFVTTDIKKINCLAIACLILGSYVTYLASMSPTPPLRETNIGGFLVIVAWTLLMGFIAYLKLCIVSIFRTTISRMLFNAGAAMQIGSASGAVLSFLVINLTNCFQMNDNCATS